MAEPIVRTVRVLLVDDEEAEYARLRGLLSDSVDPVEVAWIPTYEAGLEALVGNRHDVCLLDLHLESQRSGLDLLRAARQGGTRTPVILLTREDTPGVRLRAVEAGASDYLARRDLDARALERAVRYALDRSRLVVELGEAHALMEQLTMMDSLTGILNRRGLEQVLSREVALARWRGMGLVAVLVDLDDFKRVNDSLGHAVGDVVLREVAHRIKDSLRSVDYVARVGGDAFMALLPHTRLAEGLRAAEKVRLAIGSSPVVSMAKDVRVTASLGVSKVAEVSSSVEELLAMTHRALQQSKQAGKNRTSSDGVQLLDGPLSHPLQGVIESLKRGDRFRAVKQPIFRLKDEQRVGHEFLARSTVSSFTMPDVFFRIGMEANILTVVDHNCFKACIAASAASEPGSVSHLNLLPSTMLDIPPQVLIDEIQRAGAERESQVLEVSEQQIIGDPSYLAPAVAALKREGFKVAIDDVGFGRSCLESLVLLEPHVVKVDRHCVHRVAEDPVRQQSLKRLVKVANALGAEIVAEGIETREDLDAVRELGVPYGQGFLWGKPA